MLKRRIIPVELLLGGRLVKPVEFGVYRDVGDPVKSSKVYSDQDADELILLDIDRDHRNVAVLAEVVRRVAAECFVPLTAGGGVTSAEDAAALIAAGADKVVVNGIVYRDPGVTEAIAGRFGAQAVVAGVDARLGPGGDYILYSDCGRHAEQVNLEGHIAACVAHGAGEILVQSIDRDGTMAGYDLNLVRRAAAASSVPVIALAGAGHFLHLREVFDVGADAAACGSLFNFGDNNPLRAKAFLKNYGIPLKRI